MNPAAYGSGLSEIEADLGFYNRWSGAQLRIKGAYSHVPRHER